MKKGKKLVFSIIAVMIAGMLVLSGCAGGASFSDTVKVGVLNGPTGIGALKLKDNEKIELKKYQAADEAAQKLIANEIDIAAVPSNLGAVLYNKTKGDIVEIATVAQGVLYLVGNDPVVYDDDKYENDNDADDADDVDDNDKDDKDRDDGRSLDVIDDMNKPTIYASGKGGTPEYVLRTLLNEEELVEDVDYTLVWLDSHADVVQKTMQNKGSLALLPEPFVSNVTAKNPSIKLLVDLNREWADEFKVGLPMGVLVCHKSFVEERAKDVELFLKLWKESADYVNEASDEALAKIVEEGYLPNEQVAKAAIPRCTIDCITGEDSKNILKPFYETLYRFNPKSVGGSLPADDFYFELG